MRRDRRKAMYRRERNSLEEMQRKTLRREKDLAFSEDTCLEKKKNAVESDPEKS